MSCAAWHEGGWPPSRSALIRASPVWPAQQPARWHRCPCHESAFCSFPPGQTDAYLFNRGALLNAAILLLQGSSYDYFVFQDVDTVPQPGSGIRYAFPSGPVPLHLTPFGIHPKANFEVRATICALHTWVPMGSCTALHCSACEEECSWFSSTRLPICGFQCALTQHSFLVHALLLPFILDFQGAHPRFTSPRCAGFLWRHFEHQPATNLPYQWLRHRVLGLGPGR